MLPITLSIVFGVGLFVAWGERAKLYGATEGTAIFAVLVMIVLTVRTVVSATKLHQLDQERKEAAAEVRKLSTFPEENLAPVLRLSANGEVLYGNGPAHYLMRAIGWTSGQPAPDILASSAQKAHETSKPNQVEVALPSGKTFLFQIAPIANEGYVNLYGFDITERKQADNERETTLEFLHIVNTSNDTTSLVEASVRFFKEHSRCEAVGLRLKEGDDYPYYEAHGFPEDFTRLENSLCSRNVEGEIVRDVEGYPIMECMCGNVICGRFDPSKSFFSQGGSFWSNNTTKLLATTTDADRQARTRNRCNGEGYESVALIPLSFGDERIGLLQMNDRRIGMFSEETIALWERLAGYLSVALAHSRAEEWLKESQQDLSTAQAVAHIGSWRMDVQQNLLEWSEENHRIFGIPDGTAMTYETFLSSVHPDDREHVDRKWMAALKGEPYDIDHRIIVGDTIKWVRERADLEFDKNGNLIGGFGITQDITDRKRAAEALKQSEAQHITILENLAEGLVVADLEGRLIYWNPASLRMHGYSSAEEGHKKLTELADTFELSEMDGTPIPPDQWPLARALRGEVVRDWEVRVRRTNEDWQRIFNYRATPVKDESGQTLLAEVSVTDITERKKYEQVVRDAEHHKMDFYRSTISAATDGKLIIAERDEIVKLAGTPIASWKLEGPDDVGVVRHGIEEISLEAGMDDTRRGHLAVSVGEATTNAVKNAGRGDTSLHRIGDTFVVVVSDSGAGIPALTLPSMALRPGFSTAGTLGMGYKMMIKFADKVYLATGPEGTTVAIEMTISPLEEPSNMGWMAAFAGGIP